MSEQIDQLAAALVAAQGKLPTIAKTETGKIKGQGRGGDYEYSYKYADLAGIIEQARPIVAEEGLAVSQWPSSNPQGQPTLVTMLIHLSGQYISDEMLLLLAQQTPQAQGSGITYAKRYAYCAALGIITDDDDGAAASRPAPHATGHEDHAPDSSERPFTENDPLDANDPGPLVVRKGKLKAMQRVALNEWCVEQGMPDHPARQSVEQREQFATHLATLENA